MTRRVFEDTGIEPGIRALDLASGAGDVCMLLAAMVGPTSKVIGLEMDAGAIKFARERASAAGFGDFTAH